jgi:hypothetical protein
MSVISMRGTPAACGPQSSMRHHHARPCCGPAPARVAAGAHALDPASMHTRLVSCGVAAERRGGRGGGGDGRVGWGGRQQQAEQQEEEQQEDDERGWWERPEEVSMSRYAVEPLEAYQEEALEVAYATYGRRKMKVSGRHMPAWYAGAHAYHSSPLLQCTT